MAESNTNLKDDGGASTSVESDIFVPPSPGADPLLAVIR
jgi:hypothetical protein